MDIITLSASGNKISLGQALNISLTGMLVVFIVLIILAALVSLMSKLILKLSTKKNKDDKKSTEKNNITEKITNPQIDLIDVDEKSAAVIMAIVSNESKIPLDHLKFNYIKLIKEEKQ